MKVNTKTNSNRPNNGNFPRFGRPLRAGTYKGKIAEVKEDTVEIENEGVKEERGRLTFTLVIDAPAEAAPEGPVKIDHRVLSGSWQMDNLVEVFFPDQVGKEFDLNPAKLIGAESSVTTNILPSKPKNDGSGTSWPERSVVKRFVGPATLATPDEDAF